MAGTEMPLEGDLAALVLAGMALNAALRDRPISEPAIGSVSRALNPGLHPPM